MPWSTDDIPDLSGKTAVVTGANGGLGLETARALAGAGAHVVMAARNQTKAAEAKADVLEGNACASLEVVELDLASQASVKAAGAKIAAAHPVIDILVNNAGLMAVPERRTEDGYEMQFGVNHLGHWTLTSLLLPSILRADAGRVVSVSSTAHHVGRAVDPDNPHLDGNYGEWKAYGQSKLANFHFAIGLQRQFEAAGVDAQGLCAHPGLTNSELQATSVTESDGGSTQKFFHSMAKYTGMSTAGGARPQLRASTDPEAAGGTFWGPLFVNNGPAVRKPILRRVGLDSAIETLWTVSEKETGMSIDVTAAAAG